MVTRKRWSLFLCSVGFFLGAFCASTHGAQAEGRDYAGPGPFSVSMSTVSDQGLLFTPSDPSASDKKWPAVVFAHGLCGPTTRYSDTLKRVSSWGFIIIANEKQEDCGEPMSPSHPVEAMKNFFSMPFKLGSALNFDSMAKNVESNVEYLLTRDDVNPDAIALMGHSMGGGIIFDVAANLTESQPDIIKAIIGLAPWNGVKPHPSSVVEKITAPILIFCSMSDALCPCSGEVTITDTQGLMTGPASMGIPWLFGPGSDSTWHGGSMAIFENARNATLIEVKDVSHFTIAGTDDGAQMQDLADFAHGISGLNFNEPDRPYRNIPTLEYAVAFLNQALKLDSTKGRADLAQASSDPRLAEVKTSP
ncbi:MAG: dienelactone hydrolase family protein [Myxococcota bacterium]|nr:dienelactone hydrolase family protein [Myxococcota bacterium]